MNLKMKKNLDSSFLTSLNDGAYYADKNEPKQPQVCIKNLKLQLIQIFRFLSPHQNFRGLG